MPLRIAIIDSGINRNHSHVSNVSGGHAYRLNGNGKVESHSDYADEIGHGTAIAGILSLKAPFADLYAVKIFEKELRAPASVLLAALKWAIEEKIKIILLSLGTESEEYREDFEALCSTAHEQGIIILAAARSPWDEIIPAVFDTVLGVFWDHDCSEDMISHHPGAKILFGAHGWPRKIPGIPQEVNFRGSSFAVAHMTGKVAQIAEKHPGAHSGLLREKLRQLAVTNSSPD